jgi:hypothetical protein
MRAREFISEAARGNPDEHFLHANPGTLSPKDMEDLYRSRSYDEYRISMLTGMDPTELEKMDTNSWVGNKPLYTTYTPEEHDKVLRAMKKMGHKAEHHAYVGSREHPEIYKKSPVTSFKGYGK